MGKLQTFSLCAAKMPHNHHTLMGLRKKCHERPKVTV